MTTRREMLGTIAALTGSTVTGHGESGDDEFLFVQVDFPQTMNMQQIRVARKDLDDFEGRIGLPIMMTCGGVRVSVKRKRDAVQ